MNCSTRYLLAVAVFSAATLPAAADLKIVTRRSNANGQFKSVSTMYVQGQRQRQEYGSGKALHVTIAQCDAKKVIDLNLDARLFAITELGPDGLPLNQPNFWKNRATTGAAYTYTITTEDTGRRAKVFGFDAWHVRDTIVTTNSAGPASTKSVVDYWYVDVKVREGCDEWPQDWREALVASDPRHKLNRIGTAKRGFPVLARTVSTNTQGKPTESVVEVTELSTAPLDAQLFDIPKDFQPVLIVGGKSYNMPDTPRNRMKATWDQFWVSMAKFIY